LSFSGIIVDDHECIPSSQARLIVPSYNDMLATLRTTTTTTVVRDIKLM